MVLARTGGLNTPIRFADLGLAADREYVAFEFWTKSFLGAFRDAFTPGDVDPRFGVQVFCLREKADRPQLLATNRHVSCGAMDVPVFPNTQDMPELAAWVEAKLDEQPMWGYLIDGHGLYAWGRDMAEARRHLEAFEFLLGCELELRTLKP